MRVHARWNPRRVAPWGAAALALAGGLALSAEPAGAASPHSSSTTIVVVKNPTWGSILALSNGKTIYRLTADKTDKSVCTGSCAAAWPPVLLAAGQHSPSGKGVSHLGTITRANGARQVTYEGIPLYTFVGDKRAGEATGNIKDTWGHWWVVNPASPKSTPHRATSSAGAAAGVTGVAY